MAVHDGSQETSLRLRYHSGFLLAATVVLLLITSGCVSRFRTQAPPAPVSPTPTSSPAARPTPNPTFTVVPSPEATATQAPAPTPDTLPAIRAKIEIVWPHEGASVREASLANITVYLLALDANESPPCDWTPIVRLWVAENAEPARPVAIGKKRMVKTDGRTFPVWDFNDVDISAARDPANKLTFFATVDSVRTYHNIWVHAQDARTILPQPDRPSGLVDGLPESVDARIEIVWPHGGLPAEQAPLANITVYLFESETLNAISPESDWRPSVRLHRSLNAEAESPALSPPEGQPRTATTDDGKALLVWDFNDVDVSAAQDRLNKIYFWVSVDDTTTFPNVWAHGADTPTFFPQVDLPASCR